MDYFTLLGLPPAFDLDLKALEKAYFIQQKHYHPDRFVGRPSAERQEAMQRSVDINNAYNQLKKPLSRAQYLLHLQGIAVGTDADTIKPSPVLLMESMELRQQIAEADERAKLDNFDTVLSDMMTKSIDSIAKNYAGKHWDAMAQETLRLGYLLKAQEEVMQYKKLLQLQGKL